jgi:alanine racemase
MWNITGAGIQNNMRPTYLEVNLNQLKQNVAAIRAHVGGAKVMPMVKANAYGHGVDGVAPFIEPYVDYFGVAIVEEGIHLRSLGIKKPILVAGGTLIEQLPLFLEHDLTLTASSLDLLTAADHLAESTGKMMTVHLKIDTGMERVGVHEYEAEEFLLKSIACSHLGVEGIYTHLANSEVMSLRARSLRRFPAGDCFGGRASASQVKSSASTRTFSRSPPLLRKAKPANTDASRLQFGRYRQFARSAF